MRMQKRADNARYNRHRMRRYLKHSPPDTVRLLDPVVLNEIPLIRKIIHDETWYEGERRGCWVSSDDPVVKENVCRVICRVGEELRRNLTAQLAADAERVECSVSDSRNERAA
jgi:hypothetical protein